MSNEIADRKADEDRDAESECPEVVSLRSQLSLREKELVGALQIIQEIYASPGWKMIERYRGWVQCQRLLRPRLFRRYEKVALWLLSKLGANRSVANGLRVAGAEELKLTCEEGFDFTLERCSAYLGQLFVVGDASHREKGIEKIEIIFGESTVAEAIHIPAGQVGNFKIVASIPPTQNDTRIRLRFVFEDLTAVIVDATKDFHKNDPVHHVLREFERYLRSLEHGKVLEIGSRARSGIVYRSSIVPDCLEYVGLDILPGPNVDIVGDAHKLSQLFPPDSFDAVYSIAVFEHLMMPWLVALEMNKVMKVGAVGLIVTHQTFPLHEMPWDFWRYSTSTWRALFNKSTGFEVIDARMGEPVAVVGNVWNTITQGFGRASAFMSSQVLFRKVSGTTLAWAVDPDQHAETAYPA